MFSFYASFFLSVAEVFAQNHLDQEIDVDAASGLSIRQALDQVAAGRDFYFSYASSLIGVDARLPVERYSGTVKDFLTLALGTAYDYKEIPGYIIIRYAPGMLDVAADIENSEKQTTIKGYIKDYQTQESIAFVSIYERSQLISTMSNQQGYFEIKLKNPQSSLWVTLSKENYRDTTFMILPTVDIKAKTMPQRLRFSPQSGNVDMVEGSFFGRLFIGFRQRIQRINLGGFLGESPYQMSLVPGVGSQGMFSSQMVNNFSLNLIGGYSAGTEGFETAGIFNINQQNAKGFQVAGVANMVGGGMEGMQVAGLYNIVLQKANGFQVAGLYNRTKSGSQGLQVAGLYNRTDSGSQHQIAGLFNKTDTSDGVQIAGLWNYSSARAGALQLAGLINYSHGAVDRQVGGLVNRATYVRAFQLGFINVADSSNYPIGLLNFIANGKKSLSAAMDESGALQLSFRSGGRKLYGVLGLGYFPTNSQTPAAYDVGVGVYLIEKRTFSLDTEWVNRVLTDFRSRSDFVASFRLLPAYKMSPKTKVFLGPTLNFAVLDQSPDSKLPGQKLVEYTSHTNVYGVFAGVITGMQVSF
nr:hypothetical protein [Cytophagales bacterium]